MGRRPSRGVMGALIGITLILAVLLIAIPYYQTYVAPWHKAVLRVNDEIVDMSYFIKMLRLFRGKKELDPTLPMQVLLNLQNAVLINQEAKKRGLRAEEERIERELRHRVLATASEEGDFPERYQVLLEKTGLSDQEYRDFVRTTLLMQQLREEIFREQNLPTTAEQVHVQAILVESAEKAMEVINRIGKGESFSEIARTESMDHQNKERGGDWGWLCRRENQVEAVEQARVLGILSRSREESERARESVRTGGDFQTVALKMSVDEESRRRGGNLGWVARGSRERAFDEAVFALRIGSLSEPIETTEGFWVIEVLEKSPGGKLIDHIAFHLNIGAISPPLRTKDGYYVLRVLDRESNRALSRARTEMLKNSSLDRWLERKAQEGSSQGWLVWYWDSDRYAWAIRHAS